VQGLTATHVLMIVGIYSIKVGWIKRSGSTRIELWYRWIRCAWSTLQID